MDNDPKVRYYACESLYNIAKVLRAVTLSYFNEIFDCLSKVGFHTKGKIRLFLFSLFVISNQRSRVELNYGEFVGETRGFLHRGICFSDRLLKDIVIETCTQFEVIAFIPLLRERIYVRNAFTRQFIVSWVCVYLIEKTIVSLVFCSVGVFTHICSGI